MGSIDEKSLELEVKHKVNGSWHPCSVSLSTGDSKFGIIVKPANSNEKDVIYNREDAIARLRFRSTPIQDGECSHIKKGDRVLAMYKDQFRSMLLDAMIEKPNRVKHSNRVFCRCTFEIKWLNPELKDETMTIPSKSIMKLSGKEIDSHSAVAAFLNSVSPTDGAEPSSFLSLLEETNYEADVEGILEKQIEEISKLAEGSMECPVDLLEVKRASLGGRKQSKAAVSSNNQNNLRRATRSQNKEQVKVEPKKVLEDDKPFLSPLAARAALASLVHDHELPMKRQLSFSLLKTEGREDSSQKDSTKQIKMNSLDINYKYVRCGDSSKDNTVDLSNINGDGDSDAHRNGAKGNTTVNTSKGSTNVGRLSGRSTTTRVTRSSANADAEILSDEVRCQSSKEKFIGPVNSTRKTRSSMHKEIEDSSDEGRKEYSVGNNTRLTRSKKQKEQGSTHGMSEESEGKKESSSTIVDNLIDLTSFQSTTRRVSHSSLRKEIEASSDAAKKQSSSNKVTSSTATSTRSQNQAPDKIQDTIDASEDVTHGKSKSKKRSIDSHADLNKRTRASHAVMVTTEDSGAILEDNENASHEKKKSARKKITASVKSKLRCSPRFTQTHN